VPLDKRPSDRVGTVAVTFRVPAELGARSARLLGEFSDWSPLPMAPAADGGYELTVEVPAGAAYRFRYLLDDARWANDWEADDYVPNEYGSDDSLVVVETAEPADATDAGSTPARNGDSSAR